ncbi:hypothetical protein C8E83_1858 [Frondihabitans australicus]|uniref:Uncharacterized protein n=1 Tax=Frondihabitans australicus TaxID=386892 RepID=A0A495IG57_9MICO|nr:hypothetical protein C8E83_1858 [Frondihabitans australicus]
MTAYRHLLGHRKPPSPPEAAKANSDPHLDPQVAGQIGPKSEPPRRTNENQDAETQAPSLDTGATIPERAHLSKE